MVYDTDKLIITDVDGVLLNWEFAFDVWISRRGGLIVEEFKHDYYIHRKYGISVDEGVQRVREFNESASIGFLPPLRDAMYYVDLLHRKHGYTFHCITSMSRDSAAQKLIIDNLEKLFGKSAFYKFTILDTLQDKRESLFEHKNSGALWVEDISQNAIIGQELGLESVLMEHGHNMHDLPENIPVVKNWKEIYEMVI